jgi:hypothetical protein
MLPTLNFRQCQDLTCVSHMALCVVEDMALATSLGPDVELVSELTARGLHSTPAAHVPNFGNVSLVELAGRESLSNSVKWQMQGESWRGGRRFSSVGDAERRRMSNGG